MATTPIIRIYNENNSKIQETWNAGVLDLSSSESFESDEKVINVWNNRFGTTDVPDLIGCNITTKNINGDDIYEQVVTETWVRVCVDSIAQTDPSTGKKIFSEVGGPIVAGVASQGATEEEKKEFVIRGSANNGVPDDSLVNYSKITMKVVPTLNAKVTVHEFKTRISGYYI